MSDAEQICARQPRGNEPFSTAEAGLKEEWRMQRPGSLIQAFTRLSQVFFPAILHSAETLVLGLGEKPWIFDFRTGAFAAQHVGDLARRVSLAVDIGFVGVRRGVAGDNKVRQG